MNKIKRSKVMSILGTRPEIIRLSQILPKLDDYFDHTFVYTRQNYDYSLSEIFFKEFGLRKPNYLLSVKANTVGAQIANIMMQSEKVLQKVSPDVLLIIGDTNSALSAIMAKRMKIPIFHMEAGNRSFDWNIPEEINRRMVDHISDFNLAYTEHSRRYLISEGIHPSTVFVTGSPLTEVFYHLRGKIQSSVILETLQISAKKFFLVSAHREENVDREKNLHELIVSLNFLAEQYKSPIIFSLHPRTRIRLKRISIRLHSLIVLHEPFGFFDYNELQLNARCVLSDSGSIQEESAILGFPAVQIRVSTERPEAFDTGSIMLTGFQKDTVINAVAFVISQFERHPIEVPGDYGSVKTSEKVVKLIMGLGGIRKYQGQ